MKAIYKTLAAVALMVPMTFTSCIEETFPTSGATEEQVSENSQGIQALVNGMPAYLKKFMTFGYNYGFNYGYASIFCMLNVQTNDMFQNPTGYDWYSSWAEVSLNVNSTSPLSQINWYLTNFVINSTNNVIAKLSNAPRNSVNDGYLAQAYVFRASTYLDMARIYEFLPNDVISSVNESGNDVSGLTVPIVTPDMTEEQRNNNPRATHDQMLAFLINDLETAINLYKNGAASPTDKQFPSLAVAYGIMARVYMWDENYPKAAEYADLALGATSATPTTKDQWLNTTDGFNNASVQSWMWAIQQENNDDAVQSWTNWTSFMSPELRIGYGGYGSGSGNTYFHIDRQLYDLISDHDFRKLTFKAPAGHPLAGQESILDPSRYESLDEYAGFKFRPGNGNMSDESTAFATDIPLMRIEEMWFIKAEAEAHTSPETGKNTLETFMTNYRYRQYKCNATSLDDIIEEIILQKRIEFWGENITFFDVKRLGMSVNRAYDGSNWPSQERLVSSGRPGWMNWPFVDYESDFNMGVRGYLNPNVGKKYLPVY